MRKSSTGEKSVERKSSKVDSTEIHPEWPRVSSLAGVFNRSAEREPDELPRKSRSRHASRQGSTPSVELPESQQKVQQQQQSQVKIIDKSEDPIVVNFKHRNSIELNTQGRKNSLNQNRQNEQAPPVKNAEIQSPFLAPPAQKDLEVANRRGSIHVAAAVEAFTKKIGSGSAFHKSERRESANIETQAQKGRPEQSNNDSSSPQAGSTLATAADSTEVAKEKIPPTPKARSTPVKNSEIKAAALVVANAFGGATNPNNKTPIPVPKSRKDPSVIIETFKSNSSDSVKNDDNNVEVKSNKEGVANVITPAPRQIRTNENRLGVYSKDTSKSNSDNVAAKPIASVQPTEVIPTREIKISEIVEKWPPTSSYDDGDTQKVTDSKHRNSDANNNDINQMNSLLSAENKTNIANTRKLIKFTPEQTLDKFASILVIGLAGSGKTAMIDEILDQQVPKLKKGEIVEYTLNVQMPGSNDDFYNLRVIDTPGFKNEKSGSVFPRIFATLLNYCRSQEGLRGKTPNLVLFVIPFGEKFAENENCDLIQFLKVIHHFESYFQNPKFPNFVFVLTHLTNAVRRDQIYPEVRIHEFEDLVKKYTTIKSPIAVVCAENKGESAGLQVEDGFYKLPNGEMYPSNLIAQMKTLLTRKGHISLSEKIIGSAFGSEYPNSLQLSGTKLIPQLKDDSPSIPQMKQTLKDIYSQVKIEETEISTLLQVGWENISQELQKTYPSSLVASQRILQMHKIKEFADIPSEPDQIFKLLRELPQNLAVADLLIHTLQLKIPHNIEAGQFIGQGYDLTQDRGTNISPLQFNSSSASALKTSPIGQIPNELQCHVTDDRAIVFKFFYSPEEYVLDRMKELGIKNASFPGHLPPPALHRPGYNIIKENQEPTKSTIATALLEYRAFRLTLQDGEFEFKPVFWEALSSLPTLESKTSDTVQAWRDFFNCWGTHLVKSGYGGGAIEINFKGKMLSKLFSSLDQVSDDDMTNRVFQWITGDGLDFAAASMAELKTDFLKGLDVESTLLGGHDKFRDVDFTRLPFHDVAEVRNEWKESLFQRPVMLETNLVLLPISYFVRFKDEEMALKMDLAFHYIYSQFISQTEAKQSSCAIL